MRREEERCVCVCLSIESQPKMLKEQTEPRNAFLALLPSLTNLPPLFSLFSLFSLQEPILGAVTIPRLFRLALSPSLSSKEKHKKNAESDSKAGL